MKTESPVYRNSAPCSVEIAPSAKPRETSSSQPLPFAFIVGLALVSFFTTCFFFFKDTTLYWDTAQHFVQFRDNLHSLNAFGQIAWWFPQNQTGWPNYYYSILGFPHGASPLFVGLSFLVWLLGRVGVTIAHYHPVYVVYFGFLTPLLFIWSTGLIARQILKSRAALNLALILAAFSPGVMANISDIGFLEPAAYSLIFASALLSFLKRQTRFYFSFLCFASVLLGVSCNYAFLFWNLIAIPAFVGGLFVFSGKLRHRLWRVIVEVKAWRWALCVLLFFAAALPNFTAFQSTQELQKPNLRGQSYTFLELQPGNPLEMLTASLPTFGSDWAPGYRENWTLVPRKPGVHVSYNYMGLLCVPLLLFGLVFGRAFVRSQLVLLLLLIFGVVNLSGYSPFFAWLLALPTPLRAVNHYSDLLFRAGGFILLVLGAAFGLDTALGKRFLHRPILLTVFGIATLISLGLFVASHRANTLQSASFGFTVFTASVIALTLARIIVTRGRRELNQAVWILLLVTLVDTSTQMFFYVRRIVVQNIESCKRVDETPAPDGIGLKVSSDPYYFVNSVLVYRSLTAMQESGIDLNAIEPFKLFSAAHINTNLASEGVKLSAGFPIYRSLAMDPAEQAKPEFKPFFAAVPTNLPGSIRVMRRTYTDLDLEVVSESPALVFIKDSFSRYWKAEINGQTAPIARALYNFKALAVQPGISTVSLRFYPGKVGFGLALAYGGFVAVGFWCLYLWRRRDQGDIVLAERQPLRF